MAKECINCGRKVGFISGEHLDGLLCDNCYNLFGGMKLINLDTEVNPDKYLEYYDMIGQEIDEKANPNVNTERIKQEFYKRINTRFNTVMGYGIKEYQDKIQEDLKKEAEAQEREVRHIDYANSFKDFYEYDVVTIINEDHGTIDKDKMMKILSDHAKKGWKLHSIYSNELGKNAIRILGFSTNTTACEDVLIFERRVLDLDE